MKLGVYPPQQPWGYRPPPPPKPGLSPLVIVLIVLGGVLVLGGGACVVLSLAVLGASAEADPSTASPTATTTTAPTAPVTAPTGTATAGADTNDDEGAQGDGDEGPNAGAKKAANDGKGNAGNAGTSGGSTKPGVWFCNASGSARVCGFAGACNYQMMFGNGMGPDRYLASMQAKNACENMARAKGSSTSCIVSCSLSNK